MQNIHNHLPKDLVAIVEEYSKDRTNYDKVIQHLEEAFAFIKKWASGEYFQEEDDRWERRLRRERIQNRRKANHPKQHQ